jgi:hypothetical protein
MSAPTISGRTSHSLLVRISRSRFQACVGDHAGHDHVLDAALAQLVVQIGILERAVRSVSLI